MRVLLKFRGVRRMSAIAQCEAIMIGGVGAMALIGRVYGQVELSAWGTDTSMAPSTAFCLISTAVAIWLLASSIERVDRVVARSPCAQGPGEFADHCDIIRRLDRIEEHLNLLNLPTKEP